MRLHLAIQNAYGYVDFNQFMQSANAMHDAIPSGTKKIYLLPSSNEPSKHVSPLGLFPEVFGETQLSLEDLKGAWRDASKVSYVVSEGGNVAALTKTNQLPRTLFLYANGNSNFLSQLSNLPLHSRFTQTRLNAVDIEALASKHNLKAILSLKPQKSSRKLTDLLPI